MNVPIPAVPEGADPLQMAKSRDPERTREDILRVASAAFAAHGLSGANVDYLQDLVDHLRAEGVRDRSMERLLVVVRALEA